MCLYVPLISYHDPCSRHLETELADKEGLSDETKKEIDRVNPVHKLKQRRPCHSVPSVSVLLAHEAKTGLAL